MDQLVCEAASPPSKPLPGRGFILSQSGTKAKSNARVIYQNGDILTVNKKSRLDGSSCEDALLISIKNIAFLIVVINDSSS